LSTQTKTNLSFDNGKIFFVSSNNWDSNLVDTTDITSIGNVMYTNYSIWLLITSIILLLAMVGSIVITIKQKY
jgi:NADH-ubiquinone oxidoreductase chain 6